MTLPVLNPGDFADLANHIEAIKSEGFSTDELPDEFFGIIDQRGIKHSIEELMFACHGASYAAGWWTSPVTGEPLTSANVGEKLMLIVSEVSEAMEGHRKGLMDDKLPHRPMFEVELADALIRIFDLAGAFNLDLGGALYEKIGYNATRPDHKRAARLAEGGKAY